MASRRLDGGASFSFASSLRRRELGVGRPGTARGSPVEIDPALETRRAGRTCAGLEGVSSLPSCRGGKVRSCDSVSSEVRSAGLRRPASESDRDRRAFSAGNGVVACDLREAAPRRVAVDVRADATVGPRALRLAVDRSVCSARARSSFSTLSWRL